MKKLPVFLALFMMFSPLRPAAADETPVGPGEYQGAPIIMDQVYYHIGPLNLTVPWANINVVYLFDLYERRNLVGGESVIARLWRFEGTVGAVTSLDGHGAPFVGGNLWFDNPIPSIAILSQIKPGIFGGYDWNKEAVMFGFKAAMPIF